MSKLTEFVGSVYYTDSADTTHEIVVSIVANTREEALGLALSAYPKTTKSDWEIVGGLVDESVGVGVKDVLVHETSSYWG